MKIRIVTRNSPLARWQAEHVRARLCALHPGLAVELIGVTTEADRFLERTLSSMGGKGVFVKELEAALLDGSADIAVHSQKDVPVTLPSGLALLAQLRREDCRDVLASNGAARVAELAPGARVGTSSLRRRSQLLCLRPDLEVGAVRGNVGTRLDKLDQGVFDALLLAAAGVLRLGLAHRVREYLDPGVMLPAIGQGVLAIEGRAGDRPVSDLVRPLHDDDTGVCMAAERAFNLRLGGSCLSPVAGLATVTGDRLVLQGFVGSLDGARTVRDVAEGHRRDAAELGTALAGRMLSKGAEDILREAADAGG